MNNYYSPLLLTNVPKHLHVTENLSMLEYKAPHSLSLLKLITYITFEISNGKRRGCFLFEFSIKTVKFLSSPK